MIKQFFNWLKDKQPQEIEDLNKPSKFLRNSNTQEEDKGEKDLQWLLNLAKKEEPLKHGVLASSDDNENSALQAKLKKTLQDFENKRHKEEEEKQPILKDIFKEVIAPGMIEYAERGIPLYSFILNKAEEVSLEPLFKLNPGHWHCKGEYIQSKYENLRLNKNNIEFIFNEIKKNGFQPYYDEDSLMRPHARAAELSESRMEYSRIRIKFLLVPK